MLRFAQRPTARTMPTADPSVEWLSRADPLDVFAGTVGSVMLVIALAQWLASFRVDRRALRIFAARHAAAAAGWWFAHPGRQQVGQEVPLAPALVGVVLLGVTVWALDEFLGRSTPRRRAGIAAAALLGAAAVVAFRAWRPADPLAVYAVMVLATSWCALQAWSAARAEPGVGHGVVAASFATYPVIMLGAAVVLGWQARSNLSYLIALPSVIVGITILVVSLMRAALRAQTELQRRQAAEAHLAELNATLERRVDERTAELQVLVDGLDSFARSISHDLRGSLGGTAGLSRIAIDALARGDAAKAQQLLQVIAPQLEHTASLVHELLTLTRLGDAALQRTPQPLAPIVQQALEQLAIEPDSVDALRRAVVEIGELPSLAVDATLLRQVFVNLLANALRFATSGGTAAPRIAVGYAPPRAGEPPAIYVEDNGPGFAQEAAARLFQPFVRLHGGTLSRHGIGLSIVRRIVERHGGRVWATGRPGHGAVFWFSLPAAGPHRRQPGALPAGPAA